MFIDEARFHGTGSLSLETITDIPDRLNKSWPPGIRLDLASEGGHTSIHASGGDHHRIAPDRAHNALPGERASVALEKIFEEAKLLVRQRDFGAVFEQAMGDG